LSFGNGPGGFNGPILKIKISGLEKSFMYYILFNKDYLEIRFHYASF
jgi:hypothetical protein